MNDENKIGLSIEMYEDLKETLVKAVKSTKANAGLENAQLERRSAAWRQTHRK